MTEDWWKEREHHYKIKLYTIVFLSLTAAAVLCWSALHVAQTIARAETSKITHIEKEIQ